MYILKKWAHTKSDTLLNINMNIKISDIADLYHLIKSESCLAIAKKKHSIALSIFFLKMHLKKRNL